MRTLNLGILAHVDAGKTSLTERLLHAAGVIDEIGSVDDGSTQTDSLALERCARHHDQVRGRLVRRRRHHRQPHRHTRPPGLHRRGRARAGRARRRGARGLRRRGRAGADAGADAGAAAAARPDAAVREQDRPRRRRGRQRVLGARSRRRLLAPSVVGMAARRGRRHAATTRRFAPASPTAGLTPRRSCRAQTARAVAHPVFFGSAITGAGVEELTAGIRESAAGRGAGRRGPVAGRCSRSSAGRRATASPTCACARAPCARATASRSRAARAAR